MQDKNFRLEYKVTKVDEEQRVVFGWFSIVEENGQAVIDKHGDIIPVEDIEKAVYDFVENSRMAGEMHVNMGVGHLVESVFFSADKQMALGINLGKIGWWGGFRITDDEVWKKVKQGYYPSFSIGGSAQPEEIEVEVDE